LSTVPSQKSIKPEIEKFLMFKSANDILALAKSQAYGNFGLAVSTIDLLLDTRPDVYR